MPRNWLVEVISAAVSTHHFFSSWLITTFDVEYSIDDPALPAAVKTVCSGGENATTVMDSSPFGADGALLTTGSCAPPVTASGDSSDVFSGKWVSLLINDPI